MIGVAQPAVVAVPVDGGEQLPRRVQTAPTGRSCSTSRCRGHCARATIAVYFAPNTDQGFLDAVTTASTTPTTGHRSLSISWGSAEDTWTAQAMTQMEQAFVAAAAMGVTVTVAAGDNGSTDGAT